jgi:hypothetical protein
MKIIYPKVFMKSIHTVFNRRLFTPVFIRKLFISIHAFPRDTAAG